MQPTHLSPVQIISARVLFRFGLRLIVLFTFASLGASSFLALLIMSVCLCTACATLRLEPLVGPALSNWDEAAAYGCLASLIVALTQ